ncbi:hypothetical protein BTHI11S_04885 [Bosea thiooxidans]
MFHVGVLLHLDGMLEVLLQRGQHEFMVEFAVVAKLEANLLAATHLDPVGDEGHLAVLLAHHDLDDPGRFLGIARLAVSRLVAMAVAGRAGPGKRGASRHQKSDRGKFERCCLHLYLRK